MTQETGTLAELDVKPGDVVENVNGITYKLKLNRVGEWCDAEDDVELVAGAKWRIISRAAQDDKPKPWGEMTDAEKGARRIENGINVSELFDLIDCDSKLGILTWKPRSPSKFKGREDCPTKPWKTWNARYAGTAALSAADGSGYLHGQINGQRVAAHRVIWAMTHGVWPEGDIDHIDGHKKNNKVKNLRDVSRGENLRNAPRRKDNLSGITGVRLYKATGKWAAEIQKNGNREHLGYFHTIEEAAAARKVAEVLLGFHPNHGRSPNVPEPEPVVQVVTLYSRDSRAWSSLAADNATVKLEYTTRDGEPATGRFVNEAGDVITLEQIGGDA